MPAPTVLRSGIKTIDYFAARDLGLLWRGLDTSRVARVALHDVLPQTINIYGEASASLAADWYDQTRAEAGVRGLFQVIPAEVGVTPGTGGAHQLADWVGDYLDRTDTGVLTAEQISTAQQMINGGVQRRIANAARSTITESSIKDPEAAGWYRYTASTGCEFCRMLAGRGAVYSEQGVKFGAHDHCSCMAAPAFKGGDRVDDYKPTTRNIGDADRDRVRAWITDNIH